MDNIPLVQGEFALRWKVNNTAKSIPRASYSRSASSYSVEKTNSRKSEKSVEEFNSKLAEKLALQRAQEGVPSVVVSTDADSDTRIVHRPSPLLLPSQSSDPSSSSSSSNSTSPKPSATTLQSPCQHHDPTPTPPKGMTQFLPLKDHSVVWSQNLHTTVKMTISRHGSTPNAATSPTTNDSAGLLQSSPMKLVVVQRIIPGDPGAPRNPRLGAVYLDLAEYAGVNGETTRKYLLRESKINATLKLTISVTHVGGETDYKAPALPKAEIMNGVSGLLESDVYKTRPKALDICGPYYNYNQYRRELAVTTLNGLIRENSTSHIQNHSLSDSDSSSEEEEDDLDGRRHGRSLSLDGHSQPSRTSSYQSANRSQNDLSAPKPSRRKSKSPRPSRPALSPIAGSPHPARTIPSPLHSFPNSAIPFDITHLPYAYGPKTTENLIEALFNPVPVIEKPGTLGTRTRIGRIPIEDNPFVYFIPKESTTPVRADVDMTIGRSFTRQQSTRTPSPSSDQVGTVRSKTATRALSAPNPSGSNDSAEVSSVYSVATTPSSASVSTSESGAGSSKGSSNRSANSKSYTSSSSKSPSRLSEPPTSGGSETTTSPSKSGGWLRRRHHTTIIAQSNPHSGTKPDLYNHVDSVVGIVL